MARESQRFAVRTKRRRQRKRPKRSERANRVADTLGATTSGERLRRHMAKIEIAEVPLHVFVLFQRIQEGQRGGELAALQLELRFCAHAKIRVGNLEALRAEIVAHARKTRRLRVNHREFFVIVDVLHAVNQRLLHERVLRSSARVEFDEADRVEHPADASGFSESALVAAKKKANLAGGA